MYYMKNELVNSNFDLPFEATVYHNVTTGIEAFQRLINVNRDFFNYNKGKAIFSRLLTFSVESSFNKSAFTPTANYNVMIGKLNDYGYNGLYVRTKDFVINIAKTYKKFILPNKAGYKKRLAKLNSDSTIQLYIDTLSCKVACEEFMYGFITYGYYNDNLTHINILVPSSDYAGTIYKT